MATLHRLTDTAVVLHDGAAFMGFVKAIDNTETILALEELLGVLKGWDAPPVPGPVTAGPPPLPEGARVKEPWGHSKVVGTSFRPVPWEALMRDWEARGPALRLDIIPEPTNPHDPQALAVYYPETSDAKPYSHHLGHIPAETAHRLYADQRASWHYATIDTITGGTPDKPNRGINITIWRGDE